MDAAYTFAKHLITTKYEDIPADAVDMAKKEILDIIGTALAGSSAAGIKPLVELAKEWGGREESTITSYGGKVPAFLAAQVNASMSHALDYDDYKAGGGTHCAVVVIPTALAMAERRGGVNGKELITAVALGVDLVCRIDLAAIFIRPDWGQGGWHFTSVHGRFSTAATAGRILGLNEEQMVNALGIAYHQAAGNLQCVIDGALTKRMGPGFASRDGIMAALMAQKGITGAKDSMEGERGLYHLYYADCDRDRLLGGLGKRFEGINMNIKPYPCCGGNTVYVDDALGLVLENDIKPEEVQEIMVTIPGVKNIAHHLFFPVEVKGNPRNIVDCQFSVPWSIACAVVRRRAGLAEFTVEAMNDPAIRKMAQKVKPVVDESLPDDFLAPGIITMKTSRGEFTKKGVAPSGSPENPLSLEFIVNKFTECATWGVKRLSKDSIDKIVDMVNNLEKVKDVSQIPQLLG